VLRPEATSIYVPASEKERIAALKAAGWHMSFTLVQSLAFGDQKMVKMEKKS